MQEGRVTKAGGAMPATHNAGSLADGMRNTLRRNGASHPNLAHSGGSGIVQVPPEATEAAQKVKRRSNACHIRQQPSNLYHTAAVHNRSCAHICCAEFAEFCSRLLRTHS